MNRLRHLLEALASVKLTLFCLALMMVLVLCGTLAQVNLGTFAAQKEFFNRWWIFRPIGGTMLPLFPGGLTVGSLWFINLVAAFAVKFKFRWKDSGLLISHFGVILLLAGQFLTQQLAVESQLPIEIGETKNYSESPRETELVFVESSDAQTDEVTTVPYSIFSHRQAIAIPGKPFSLAIKAFYPNAQLSMAMTPLDAPLATEGVGRRVLVEPIPVTHADDEVNTVTASVEVLEGGKSLGTWLVSNVLGMPQSFRAGGKEYQISIRAKRYYYPFRMTLKEFRHDVYPGTDIPKNFSSLVKLENTATGENRDALIYMNNPLRYEGKTFYQASFGKGDQLSVLQVVKNPAWVTPYLSCLLVILGLAMQFLQHLIGFLGKKK